MSATGSDVKKAIADLATRLPAGAVSVAHADRLAASTDLWPRHMINLARGEPPQLPAAVVWPEDVDDLVVVVKRARATGLTLVPYGAGSSVVGGATTTGEQLVVDLKRMDALLTIDGEERTATAEAGIMGELLERQLNRAGFTQGHFPSSIYCSTLGGWIAARSAGQMSSRYGKIEDQVVGGVVVLGDGRVLIQDTNPVRARAIDELIGSEGTLGIWAQATVRVHPVPETRVFRGFDFPDLDQSLGAAQAWLFAGLAPSVLRIYDPLDTVLHRTTHTHERKDRGANRLAWLAANLPRLTSFIGDRVAASCRCILGFEGAGEICEAEMAMAMEIAKGYGAEDLGPEAGEAWYATRYAISYGQSRAFRAGVAVDTMEVACPWERVHGVYDAVRSAALGAGAQVLAHFSHVYLSGCSIYFTYALPVREGLEGYQRLWRAALSAAVAAGANVSHHHGAGRHKAAAVAESLGGATHTVVAMRERLDPDRIMNPGVLVDQPIAAADPKPLAEAPPADGFVCVAAPTEKVADIERRLSPRGRTLGASAALFGEMDLLTAARQGSLWRTNPQLRMIEPMVWGVDATIDGVPHRAVPAPRSAIGPDLIGALLEGDGVERLWLRCESKLPAGRWFTADLDDCLQAASDLAANPQAHSLRMAVSRDGAGRGLLQIELPEDGRLALALGEVERRMAYGFEETEIKDSIWPTEIDPAREPFFFAGTWRVLDDFVNAPELASSFLVVPWLDPVGAAGFVLDGELSPEAFSKLAGELGVAVQGRYPKARAARRAAKTRKPIAGYGGAALATPLRLAGDAAALENCTYCPKLCRFSCPVAIADGSETLIPRQLMLTANLDRTSRTALEPDVAARLWSCVDCGGCLSFCEHGNDVTAVLGRARSELLRRGAAPKPITTYLAALRATGRPPDRPVKDDAALALTKLGDAATAKTWLFLGCQSGKDEGEAAAQTLALCRDRFGPVHVLAGRVTCCGHPLWRWGDREGFASHAQAFAGQLRGVERLVVDDGGCAAALRDFYPQVGVDTPEIVTTMELLRDAPLEHGPATPLTIHHACHAGGAASESWLRERLAESAGDMLVPGSVVEGESGSCGGMLLAAYDGVLAERVAAHAATDLLGGGAEQVVASSPSCRRRLREAGVTVVAPIELWGNEREG